MFGGQFAAGNAGPDDGAKGRLDSRRSLCSVSGVLRSIRTGGFVKPLPTDPERQIGQGPIHHLDGFFVELPEARQLAIRGLKGGVNPEGSI